MYKERKLKVNKSYSFTIMEMLVVMTIMCILMSFVFSVVMKGTDRAKETRVISDTRQGNLITYMEGADSDYENLPQHIKEGRFGDNQ